MIYNDIRRHSRLFGAHTELRVQETREFTIYVLNGDVTSNRREKTTGVSARSFIGGAWGFASSPLLDDGTIERTVRAAAANAEFLSSRGKREKIPLPRAAGTAVHDAPRSACPSQQDYVDFARALDARLRETHPELLSRRIYLSGLEVEKHVLTSEGSVSSSLVPRIVLNVGVSRNGRLSGVVQTGDTKGGRGYFEEHFGDPSALFPDFDCICERLAMKAEGVYAEPGIHDVILGPDLAGILAHEAIGHTVEADLVLGGSVAADYMDMRVGSDLVSMTDFAHTAFGKPCPQPVWIDDEGTPARDAALIENGILRSYMHNRETAGRYEAEPTGNARAWLFSDEPLIRMRNTAIHPGANGIEEMIASIDRGYYLEHPSSGQADSTGEFMFGVTQGREIRGGKLGAAVLDTTVSGVAFEMLKTVTMLSNDMVWVSSGMCGKKQPMAVGMGGPAVKCRLRIGGR